MVKSYTTYQPIQTFGVIASNSNLVWLPQSASSKSTSAGRAVVGGLEHVLTWDIKSSSLLSKFQDGSLQHQCCKIAFEKTTGLIAAGYTDGSIRIWDSQSGEIMITFNGHKSAVSCLAFDKSGIRLVSGSKDTNIIMWDLVGEVGMYRLRSHRDQVTQVIFAGDEDQYLISTSKEGYVKLWDLETQHCTETHVSHRGECWSGDLYENTLVTTGNSREVKVWKLDLDAELGSQLVAQGEFQKSNDSCGNQVKFHPSGSYFAIANSDKSIELWKVKSQEQIKKSVARKQKRQREKGKEQGEEKTVASEDDVEEWYSHYAMIRTPAKVVSFDWCESKKHQLDLVTNLSNNSIQTFSVPTGSSKKNAPADYQRVHGIELPGHRTEIRALSLSTDDKLVASASNGLLNVWNVKTTTCLRSFKCGYATCASFLPGDSLIVCGTKGDAKDPGKLQLFDVASATQLDELDAHDHAVWSLQVSPDGKHMISGGEDKTVKIWEFKVVAEEVPGSTKTVSRLKLKHRKTLELNDHVVAVRYSPCGKYIACSLMDYTVKVFFADTLKFYLNLYGHKLPALAIDISHDSKLIVTCSADKNIKIWGMDFGDCHKSIFAHEDAVLRVQFEPDSHNFFSVSKDNQVKFWDGDKFEMIQKFSPPHYGPVHALAIGNATTVVVTGSHDKSIRVWNQSDEEVFLSELRDNEAEDQFEQALVDSYQDDEDPTNPNDEDEDEENKERVGKTTIETLKAGERIMDALQMCSEYLEALEHHAKTAAPNAAPPPPPTILGYMKRSPEQHVMVVLAGVKPAQLEDALLVLPFDRVVELFKFIEKWTSDSQFGPRTPLICRVLFFLLQTHHKQIVTHKVMREMIEQVRGNLRTRLTEYKNQIGYNMAGLQFIKQQWKDQHETMFVDEDEYTKQQERMTMKRAFPNTA